MRLETEWERMDLKHQASLEAQRILAQARAMREATREELEAQRIYADAARLKAWSHDILMQAEDQPGQAPAFAGPGTNGNTVSTEPIQHTQPADQPQASISEPAPSEVSAKQEEPVDSSAEKKPARGVKAGK
jgi:hypothetical protein